MTTAYWIDFRGRILNIGSGTHIGQINKSPEKFGLTKDFVQKEYDKHGEPIGSEGKAREIIVKKVIDKGFIRIRLYINKYWSVTLKRLDRRAKKALGEWSYEAKKDRSSGPYMPVRILELDTDNLNTQYEVGELGTLQYEDIDDFEPRFVTSMDDFGYSLKGFRDFVA